MNSRTSQLRYSFNRKRDKFFYKVKEVAAFITAVLMLLIPFTLAAAIFFAWWGLVIAAFIIVFKIAWFMVFYWDASQGLGGLF